MQWCALLVLVLVVMFWNYYLRRFVAVRIACGLLARRGLDWAGVLREDDAPITTSH